VEANGFYYAPDPSSQVACQPSAAMWRKFRRLHCLKYGLTTNNLLGVTMVLPGGEIVTLGGKCGAQGGLDLLGLVTGSEGFGRGGGSGGEDPAQGAGDAHLAGVVRHCSRRRRLRRRHSSPTAWCRRPWSSWTAGRRGDRELQPARYPAGAEAILIIDADGVKLTFPMPCRG